MDIKKLTAAALAAATSAALTAAVPEISGVTMTQDSMRLVTITYTLADAPAVVTLDVQTNVNTSAAVDDPGWTSIGGEAVWNARGDVWKKVETGSRTITWRPDHSWPDHKIAAAGARAMVTAWALDNTPDYMAVDLTATGGADTQTYYPAAGFVPGGVTNHLYKTTKLLMRKIMAKDVEWTMGTTSFETQRHNEDAREATHQVKLDGNYYIGVYLVTQMQWSQVATNSSVSAKATTERFMRPMENVSYNEIRNTHSTSATATSVAAGTLAVDPSGDSFLGLLRSKTGIDFDLPSEAQWEFAARAGHGSGYWGDGSMILNADEDGNLKLLGRYTKNNPTGASGGTAVVGSYAPNSWGLYDMHGNVWEWCLDWYEINITAYGGTVNIDPAAPAKTLYGASGGNRVVRGGCCILVASHSRPGNRDSFSPKDRNGSFGFRVMCTAGLR